MAVESPSPTNGENEDKDNKDDTELTATENKDDKQDAAEEKQDGGEKETFLPINRSVWNILKFSHLISFPIQQI